MSSTHKCTCNKTTVTEKTQSIKKTRSMWSYIPCPDMSEDDQPGRSSEDEMWEDLVRRHTGAGEKGG